MQNCLDNLKPVEDTSDLAVFCVLPSRAQYHFSYVKTVNTLVNGL